MNRKNKKETKTETTSTEHRADSLKMITDQTQEKKSVGEIWHLPLQNGNVLN